MTQLKGKNVLITGAATGIGKELAKIVLTKGVQNLVLWDNNQHLLHETIVELSLYNINIHPIVADVSDLDQILSAAHKTKELVGTIDILINNAGILIGKYFYEHSHVDIHNEMTINANAYMHIALEFLPEMLNQGTGHICNIASAAGMLGNPKMSIYCASKAAVIGWSDSLRIELKTLNKPVHITIVTPNYINTGMINGVKSLVPILKKEVTAQRIIHAIERNKTFLRLPTIIYTLPILKGILPVPMFDIIVGKILGVYGTMKGYKEKN